ncbi:hypothetical protein P4S72_27635 [Vibrio sp. PP-XX7]
MDWFNPNDILIPKSYFIGGQPVDGDRAAPHLDVIRPSDHVTYATLPIASANTSRSSSGTSVACI